MDIIDVFLISISPMQTLISVPAGIVAGINPVTVVLVSSIGNILPVFLFYGMIDAIKRFKMISWYLEHAYEKTERYTTKYGGIGIILATPLLGGYCTEIGVALLGISVYRAILPLFIGLLLKCTILAWLTCSGIDILECLV
ncbi:MAG: small multi-drug export protein [Methanosarcinales archaeon]|jgi:uncharacterized membrane protein|nr:small multi-drug export protein [Methanosarcinales archaeon]